MKHGNAAKINGYYNRIQARADWDLIAEMARGLGYGEIVDELQPHGNAGWKTIDKARRALWRWIEEIVLEAGDWVYTDKGGYFASYGERVFGPVHSEAEAQEFILKCLSGERE